MIGTRNARKLAIVPAGSLSALALFPSLSLFNHIQYTGNSSHTPQVGDTRAGRLATSPTMRTMGL